ncbi:hypothetical protein C2S51_037715 [Perilla frutescens var. frutescens]|nr:hypothetical protein C2S51_037715 [Perilla frutescens var. frutescens]
MDEDEEVFTSDKENMILNGNLHRSIENIESSQQVRHSNLHKPSPSKIDSHDIYQEKVIFPQQCKPLCSASKSHRSLRKQPYVLENRSINYSESDGINRSHRSTSKETEKRWTIVVDTVCLLKKKLRCKHRNNYGVMMAKEFQSEVPCQKHVVSFVEEVEPVPSNKEELTNSETDGSNIRLKEKIVVKIEHASLGSKIAAELDNQNCGQASKDVNIIMALNFNNEAQEIDGSHVIETLKTKLTQIGVEKTDESIGKDLFPEDKADLEYEDDFAFSKSDNYIFKDNDSDPTEVVSIDVDEENDAINFGVILQVDEEILMTDK